MYKTALPVLTAKAQGQQSVALEDEGIRAMCIAVGSIRPGPYT